MSPKKIHRKELKEDKLLEFFNSAAKTLRDNLSRILVGAVAIVVIIIVVTAMMHARRAAEAEAATILREADMAYLAGEYGTALAQYGTILERFQSTPSAEEAMILSGNSHLALGEVDQALEQFRGYQSRYSSDEMLLESARLGEAVCLEETGRYVEAAEIYRRSAESAGFENRKIRLFMDAGRCLVLGQELDVARELHQMVVDEYPASPMRPALLAKLAEVEAMIAYGG